MPRTAAIALALVATLLCAGAGFDARAAGAIGPAAAAKQAGATARVAVAKQAGATARVAATKQAGATARVAVAKQAVGCAKVRRARSRVAKRTARKTRGGARGPRMSRKTRRGCMGFRPAALAVPLPPASAGTLVPAAPGADPSGTSSPPPGPPGGVATDPVTSTLGVSAYDLDGFVLRMTRTSVPAGNLTVFFRNHDVSDHNLWIEGPGGDVVERISETVGEDGGASRTLAVTAGAWRLFCSLPDHGAMTRTLTVTP